jgi:ring-1,2-phenylacetyl-CoA epoxidase subunit PaaE
VSAHFHSLAIAEIVDETAEARSIRFDVPPELREKFKFKPGQHLTLKARDRK